MKKIAILLFFLVFLLANCALGEFLLHFCRPALPFRYIRAPARWVMGQEKSLCC